MYRSSIWLTLGACLSSSLTSAQAPFQLGPVVHVDDDFGPGTPGWQVWRFATLQSGVNAAPSGGSVVVFAGDYAEDVVIDRPMRVRANVKHRARILGAGGARALQVLADGVTLEGLAFQVPGFLQAVSVRADSTTLRANRGPGLVRLEDGADGNVLVENELLTLSIGNASGGTGSHGNRIESNRLVSVALGRTTNTVVRGNRIEASGNTALSLLNGANDELTDNVIDSSYRGIHVTSSPGVRVTENELTGTPYEAIYVSDSDGAVVTDNRLVATSTFSDLHLAYSDGVLCARNRYVGPGGSALGLYLYVCEDAEIQGNELGPGGILLDSYAPLALHFDSHRISGNTLGGKPVYYRVNVPDLVVPSDVGQAILVGCPRVRVQGLDLVGGAWAGVHLFGSPDATVSGNRLLASGIRVQSSDRANVHANRIAGGNIAIDLEGAGHLVTENEIEHASNAIWVQASDCVVRANRLFGNAYGISVFNGDGAASDNLVEENRIEASTLRGILLGGDDERGNVLARNLLLGNTIGIELFGGTALNSVVENSLAGNGTGILVAGVLSHDNEFHHNDFDNTLDAEDRGSNRWDDGVAGNHWRGYAGVDLDGNGIGDTPHPVAGGEQDRFPRMGLDGPGLLSSTSSTLSATAGGQIAFTLHAGAEHAGRSYLLLGSHTGNAPGIALPGGLVLPLVSDAFTDYIQANLGSAEFAGFQGALDGSGSATATWTRAPLGAAFIGLRLEFAWTLVGPWDLVSHPLAVELGP